MAAKVVIHIFHDDPSSLNTGTHVAERIRQVKDENEVDLEVYVFGPAEKALTDKTNEAYSDAIQGLIRAGVPVHTCIDIANSIGTAEAFSATGLKLEYARDAFVRYAKEGATVISF
jgi:hypothetical protein